LNNFWTDILEPGYYDKILINGLEKKRGIQANWHNLTFMHISQFLNPSMKHLDYACGPGTFIGNYSFSKSVGVDISDKQINFAKKKYGEKSEFLSISSFEKTYLEKEEFDIITILGLFEFISDDEILDLLNKLYDILKPGGKIVVTTLNYKSKIKFLIKLINKLGSVDYQNQHSNELNSVGLKKIFTKSKFKNFDVSTFLNFGVFFSIISIKFGSRLNKVINQINGFNNNYLLVGTLTKE